MFLLGVCAVSGYLAADELTLSGGETRLSGSVRSINEAGVLELSSELSPGTLLLKSGSVDKVEFSNPAPTTDAPTALIELKNGDLLPASIESLDEAKLTIVSREVGRLEIQRDSLASMQLGIQQRKVVYSGPKGADEWKSLDGALKDWTFDHDSLVASGPATALRKFDLPERFILRFTLRWQAKLLPNFQVYFADPLIPKGEASDRYYLQFGGAGLEIKREASKGKHYNTIALLNRTPNQYPDHQVKVEIRVDRPGSRLQLFLNGEPEGEFGDPIPSVPNGSAIVLVSGTQNGGSQEIGGIEVLELDDSRGRHRAEDRGDPKSDSLISRDDDRWGGRLLDIHKNGEHLVFRFKSDFQNDPLEIPEADVSTVFMASKEAKPAVEVVPPYVLRLNGEGSLSVASCQFTEDKVIAVHPLLGRLEFRRDGIVAMERTGSKTKASPEP